MKPGYHKAIKAKAERKARVRDLHNRFEGWQQEVEHQHQVGKVDAEVRLDQEAAAPARPWWWVR